CMQTCSLVVFIKNSLPLWRFACARERFRKIRRPELQAFDTFLPAFQARQISPYERVAQNVSNRRKNVRSRRPGCLPGKWDQSAELVARLILKYRRRHTDQCLPEKLQNIILFDVLTEAEHL